MSVQAGLMFWCPVLGESFHWGSSNILFWIAISISLGFAAVIVGGRMFRAAAIVFFSANAFLGLLLTMFAYMGGIPLGIASIETDRGITALTAAVILSMAAAQFFIWKNINLNEPTKKAFARRVGGGIFLLAAAALFALAGVVASGWNAARIAAPEHQARAAQLRESGQSGANLGGGERLSILLQIADPNFLAHNGMDSLTPCARSQTLTQRVAWPLDGKRRDPHFGEFRRAGYALGLETRLSKEEILSLYLDTAYMGQVSLNDVASIRGLFSASDIFFWQSAC